jgi:hypothetical protein
MIANFISLFLRDIQHSEMMRDDCQLCVFVWQDIQHSEMIRDDCQLYLFVWQDIQHSVFRAAGNKKFSN